MFGNFFPGELLYMNSVQPTPELKDDFEGYCKDEFRLPPRYHDYIDSILIPNGLVKDRLEKMALDIIDGLSKTESTSITLICVLKGAFRFASDLCEKLESAVHARGRDIAIHLDFIVASTYVNDKVGHETQLRLCGKATKFENEDLFVIEDLVDTGTTLRKLVSCLQSMKPRSVKVVSLLVKRRPDCVPFKPDYVGFEVPDRFIVGYAIDYNDQFRELPHICVVNDAGKKHFAVDA